MPHIVIDACHTGLCIEQISLHAQVTFNKHIYKGRPDYTARKLEEIKADLEAVLEKYFNGYGIFIEGDVISNHEYNVMMR